MAAHAGDGLLARGERRLLSVAGTDGIRVVLTDRALYRCGQPGAEWTRVGWHHVDRADWDSRRGRLVLAGCGPNRPWRTELPLTGGERLVPLARERIRFTTLLTSPRHLAGLGDAQITARREPGTAAVLWVVRLHPDVDRDDPRLPAVAAAAIAELRALAGI